MVPACIGRAFIETLGSMLRIAKANALEGFRVAITLTDGTERVIDVEGRLRGPWFEPIRSDPALFRQVTAEGGTLTWPTGQDLCPDVLLENDVARSMAARFIGAMTSICEWSGIKVYVCSHGHPPPHVHVKCSGSEALVRIVDVDICRDAAKKPVGPLPSAQHEEVKAWLELRRVEVNEALVKAQSGQNPGKVPPP